MPELLLELFGEEIPARMQARGAEDLCRLVAEALAPLAPANLRGWFAPRRIALAVEVAAGVAETTVMERGPRSTAPEAALAGFLRKHNATRAQLTTEGEYWVLAKTVPGIDAAGLIAAVLPPLLWRFPWPKSMRWGGSSAFTWVRPLRRILCLLDGAVVPFDLRQGEDDGHGLASGDLTEGHRFHRPGPVRVGSMIQWRETLREHRVIVDAGERRKVIAEGLEALAAGRGLMVVPDAGLLDEVAGLVEWPVPLIGAIDAGFMDLPAEVMQVSMRVNQRYFALRHQDGSAAPFFAFVANIEAADEGRAIIAGNERVLRARFADARHFWDLDRRARLESLVPKLDHIVFHARLGSQGDRVRRIRRLAAHIAGSIGAGEALADRAAELCKADLVSGMVGEFPELQGVMGRYYALHENEDRLVADAIRDHYAPRGANDAVPTAPVSVAVALADRLDQLAGFFAIGETPTGSGDPFALRRAGLGLINIIRTLRLRLPLRALITAAGHGLPAVPPVEDILGFLAERLRVQLRSEGARHDVLDAVFAAGADDDFTRLLARTDAVAALLGTGDGVNLLAAYRRAANILRIEERKDGPFDGPVDPALLSLAEEEQLHRQLQHVAAAEALLAAEQFGQAMSVLAGLRAPLDAFFENVTVNAPDPALRRNRLRLLGRVRAAIDRIADFSKIESQGAA